MSDKPDLRERIERGRIRVLQLLCVSNDFRESINQLLADCEAEMQLQSQIMAALKHTVVVTIGGVDYEGVPTSEINYLQRLRILVEKERQLEERDARIEYLDAYVDEQASLLKIAHEEAAKQIAAVKESLAETESEADADLITAAMCNDQSKEWRQAIFDIAARLGVEPKRRLIFEQIAALTEALKEQRYFNEAWAAEMKRLGVGERFVEEYTKQKMELRAATEALKGAEERLESAAAQFKHDFDLLHIAGHLSECASIEAWLAARKESGE